MADLACCKYKLHAQELFLKIAKTVNLLAAVACFKDCITD